jgi:glycosyltransferase involved in cell wall biosynthesis
LAELFQTAALILDLSSYEGLGLTVLEAGLCGVRSVVSKKGGIESLEDFKEELIFIQSPLDLNEITKKIIEITAENLEEGRDKLVENARKYSWENSINKMISTINSI